MKKACRIMSEFLPPVDWNMALKSARVLEALSIRNGGTLLPDQKAFTRGTKTARGSVHLG
jgi:hypothetical protein